MVATTALPDISHVVSDADFFRANQTSESASASPLADAGWPRPAPNDLFGFTPPGADPAATMAERGSPCLALDEVACLFKTSGEVRLAIRPADGQSAGIHRACRADALMVPALARAAAGPTEAGAGGTNRPGVGVGVGRISWFPDRDLVQPFVLPPVHQSTGTAAC